MSTALPRLQQNATLVDDKGYPTVAFHIWWDDFAGKLESTLDDISSAVAAIAAAQATANTAIANAAAAAADALSAANDALTAISNAAAAQTTANTAVTNASTAQSTANTANSNAAAAQSTADTVKRDDSISTSWTSPGSILTAADAGSNVTITIATHTRGYSDTTNKTVNGDTITGLSYSTTYYVYYDQTSRAGGTVTYHATTNANTAMSGRVAGRHFCGNIATPASGAGSTSGGVSPPGGGGSISSGDVNNTY